MKPYDTLIEKLFSLSRQAKSREDLSSTKKLAALLKAQKAFPCLK